MTDAASRPSLWTQSLLSEHDFDDDLTTWSLDAHLSELSDGRCIANITQVFCGSEQENGKATEFSEQLTGAEPFEFLQSAWMELAGNTLDEAGWAEVAAIIRQRNETIGAGFAAAVREAFHPPPEVPYVLRPATPPDLCVGGAK